MKNVISVVICALLLFPSLGFAENEGSFTYVSFSGMVSAAENSTLDFGAFKGELELDTGFGISVAAGKNFGEGGRGEVEYSYRANAISDLTDEEINVHIVMYNMVYDIQNNTMITPYLGVGVGVGWEEEAEGTEFAYQLLAGISYEVAPKADLILGYRYTGMTDLDYGEGDFAHTATANSHNFEIGFRHSF